MSRLEQRGLVRIEQGRGTYVHDSAITYALSRRTRFSENLLKQGREPKSRILSMAESTASEEVAERLAIEAGDTVAIVKSIAYADDVAVNLGQSFFPTARFPGLIDYRREHPGSTTQLYAAYGITDYLRLRTWINARLPSEEEARQLRQPRSLPVLVTHKIDVDAAGAPIGYSSAAWAGERVTFVIDNEAG
jgi:GntR family phosphonate transport system transcriptional regulator